MGLIQIENMEFYAYHGHFKEEKIVGNKFILDITLETNTIPAEKSDQLEDALDYSKVYKIIKEQMEHKSNLLEHIASRILDALHAQFPEIKKSTLKVSKINPPMGGQIGKVSVVISR
ncbi:MAG: dihydroneopterin aldolase [Bacteroidetes bacterium GWF2_38_335]|nr:MAG: dihydroneopterin aldolase [Bacteroidetes bacterium GWF2_38_335]OFY80802.1 MAG: dihydroneopterin aldolase [Bacteroidetes bacterium RIFOXYA12_FULL_38_20]HBS86202.1 dihydroneopterin aldolase [Bacteroidales bacterium]